MKILIASDTYYPNVNGAAYFTYRLSTLLAQRGHAVAVIAPSQRTRNSVAYHHGVTVYGVHSIGVPVYPDFRISPLVLSKRSIKKIVRKVKPDVIHIQNHFMIGKGVLEVAQEDGIPIMGTNHFMPENLVHYFHLPQRAEERLKKIGWHKFLHVYRQLAIVTAPTKTAAQLIERLGLGKNVIPISCGVDLQRFYPHGHDAFLRRNYKIPEKRKILLYVGRLEKEKRIRVLLRAIPPILKKVDAHLVLAGMGTLQTSLKKFARLLGVRDHVTLSGFVADDDLPHLYHAADVFVIAGIVELQSIATMEAMASGLPVVAAHSMALPELVHDGKNGFLFPPGHSTVLADSVVKILSNEKLRRAMSHESLNIIQGHDIRRTVQHYESLYKKLIGQTSL